MLNRELLKAAVEELKTELPYSDSGEQRTAAYFVASSLRLEGIASTPESVLSAACTPRREPSTRINAAPAAATAAR